MTDAANTYPGQRLGMPAAGPGSIARFGRRIVALVVDYIPVVLISVAFFDYDPISLIVIFAVLQILFIPTIGASPGQRLLGMRMIRADGAWTGIWRPIVRTVLLILVIPALISDADGRGLHDRVAGTVLIRA